MTGRELLDELAGAVVLAREVRYLPDADFEDVTDDELEKAARNMKALAYSFETGAHKLRRVRVGRLTAEGASA